MSDLGLPQRFLDLAELTRAPRELSEAGLRERFGEPTEVEIEAGQVWRARWDPVSVLVLVLAVREHDVWAAAVTIDPTAEDDRCLVLDGASNVFGVETTVWAGLARAIPVRVLDRLLDGSNDETVRWATEAAHGRLGRAPQGARLGRPLRSELDPAAQVRAELEDDLDELSRAPGLPAAVPGNVPPNLADLLGDQLDLASLCSSLDLPQHEVMHILRGKARLTHDQIDVIAGLTGLSGEDVAQTIRAMPPELVAAAEHPRWRSAWMRRAERLSVDEAEARLSGAQDLFALVARETGGRPPNWDERLMRFLHDEEVGSQGA